jgi:hypothetical protein
MSSFALTSARKNNGPLFPAINAEMVAEIGAIELLCPVEQRRSLVAAYGGDTDRLCACLQIPRDFAFAFTDDVMKILADL